MAENSGIEWTHHTFNPWIGCTKVSPACDFCYAERDNNRRKWNKNGWGPHADRHRTKTWGQPIKLNRTAAELGVRYRLFCASLADIGDNHRSIEPSWRSDLSKLIDATPNLDWLLLTKRPQNIMRLYPWWQVTGLPSNVWIGTTVENQEEADRRIPYLLQIPATVRFLSCEPLLGPVDLGSIPRPPSWPRPADDLSDGVDALRHVSGKLDWVITGGESGPSYRKANPNWFRSLRDQCSAAKVPFLFKQWEGKTSQQIKALGRELDGVVHDGYPAPAAV